jgi:uncharacterized protein (TIGR02996 family)
MTQDEAFLQAIIESPEDDAPRLIYADWLEEHGDIDRAELIRVQIALAGLEEHSARRHELQRRERALIRQHKQAWLGQLPTGVQFLGFRRGFAEVKVYARAVNYLKKAERWYTQTPLPHLFHLQLAGARDFLPAVLSTPLLSRLVELSLYGNGIGDKGAEQIAATPALGRLPALLLGASLIRPAGVRAITQSPWLKRLTTLKLGNNAVGDEGAAVLAESPSLAGVRELNLFRCGISNAGAVALAASPHLARLARLDLRINWIGTDGC